MKRTFFLGASLGLVLAVTGILAWHFGSESLDEENRYKEGETEVIVTNLTQNPVSLFKAGKSLRDTTMMATFNGERARLRSGNYFLRIDAADRSRFVAVSLRGYRCGPDDEGSFVACAQPGADHGIVPA